MAADVLVDLGTGMAIIGVMIALFLRADSRIDKLDAKYESRFDKTDAKYESRFDKTDAKYESRFDKLDAKFDVMAQDLVDVKVSVARIEGYLQARDGFTPGARDRPAARPDVDQPPAGYRQTG